MTIEGQRILWLGDIGTAGSRSLLRLPEEKLRCDIVQVAHHGYNGASLELYRKIECQCCIVADSLLQYVCQREFTC